MPTISKKSPKNAVFPKMSPSIADRRSERSNDQKIAIGLVKTRRKNRKRFLRAKMREKSFPQRSTMAGGWHAWRIGDARRARACVWPCVCRDKDALAKSTFLAKRARKGLGPPRGENFAEKSRALCAGRNGRRGFRWPAAHVRGEQWPARATPNQSRPSPRAIRINSRISSPEGPAMGAQKRGFGKNEARWGANGRREHVNRKISQLTGDLLAELFLGDIGHCGRSVCSVMRLTAN